MPPEGTWQRSCPFTGTVAETAEKAAKRKPRMHLLPYGIPLCLGFISYLIYLHGV